MRDIVAERNAEGASGGKEARGHGFRACACPRCGYETDRIPEVPCYSMRCPRCETMMVER